MSNIMIEHSETFSLFTVNISYTGDPFTVQCLVGYHAVRVGSVTPAVQIVEVSGSLICALNQTWINYVTCEGGYQIETFFYIQI